MPMSEEIQLSDKIKYVKVTLQACKNGSEQTFAPNPPPSLTFHAISMITRPL